MKLRDFPLLTDENIDSEVIAFLRQLGFDVLDVVESGLQGSADRDLLRMAMAQARIIVTHDADFGTLAVRQGEPVNGIVYLRPAHIDAKFTIGSLQTVLDANRDLDPPFILVAKRSGTKVTIRIRRLQS